MVRGNTRRMMEMMRWGGNGEREHMKEGGNDEVGWKW